MNDTGRRIALSSVSAVAALTAVSGGTEAATTYRVTGTGDSILGLA